MYGIERQKKILEYLKANNKAEVADLARVLGVTEMTVRRDLNALKEENLIYRTHGGAVYKDHPILWQHSPFSERMTVCSPEKERIGEYVAQNLICDDDTLFIDGGTTTLAVAKALNRFRHHLLIVTHNHVAGAELAGNREFTTILAGGEMDALIGIQKGSITENIIGSFHVAKAILGISSIIPGNGLYATDVAESSIKRLMLAGARQSIIVGDSSKVSAVALHRFCTFPVQNMTLVTDEGIKKEEGKLAQLAVDGVKVITV